MRKSDKSTMDHICYYLTHIMNRSSPLSFAIHVAQNLVSYKHNFFLVLHFFFYDGKIAPESENLRFKFNFLIATSEKRPGNYQFVVGLSFYEHAPSRELQVFVYKRYWSKTSYYNYFASYRSVRKKFPYHIL